MIPVAVAQSSFTIVRPADGSKVKETVHILIPKKSVPESGGYIGVFLNGKFLEARGPQSLVPASKQIKDKYLEYDLDTKALGVPDSEPGKPSKLELVLYVDFNEKPRIVDRSSIDVYIGNKANIPIPSGGLKLRYSFAPGTESIYKLDRKITLSSITKGQNLSGGRANEEDIAESSRRMLYAIDNRYDNGDGLVRSQFLTEPGKDYIISTVRGEPKKYDDTQLVPVYMRQTNTGMEVWSSLPIYYGIDGANAQTSYEHLLTVEPFPSLPEKTVKVGSTWRTRFLQDALTTDENWHEIEKFTEALDGRGELQSVEWENGHPCAVIHNTIRFGDSTTDGQKLKKAGAKFSDSKIELDEYIWFSLDSRRVLKVSRTETIDLKADQLARLNIPGVGNGVGNGAGPANNGAMGGPGGPPSGFGGPGGPPAGFGGGGRPGGGKSGGGEGDNFMTGGAVNIKQKGRQGGPPAGFGGPGGLPPGVGPGAFGQGQRGGFGQGGFGQGRTGQSGQTNNELAFIRLKIITTLTLES